MDRDVDAVDVGIVVEVVLADHVRLVGEIVEEAGGVWALLTRPWFA